MKESYTDDEIIESIRASDERRERAFGYLYLNQEFRKKAFAKINDMIKEEDTAERIFTDSLIAFVSNIRYNKYDGKSSLSTYLVGICRIQCLRHLEKQQKEKTQSEQYKAERARDMDREIQAEADFFVQSQRRYEARLTRRVYRRLSDTCRKYFRQKYGQNLSVREMSVENKVKTQSVKNALSRCYDKLREIITQDPEVMEQIRQNYGKL